MPTIARPFIAVLVITAAITTTKGTVEIAYPPYLAGYGYALSLIGFLTSLIAVLQLISRLPVGVAYRADRVKRQLAFALVAFAISTSGFAFAAGQPLAVAALSVLHGFAFGSLGTLGLALAIDVSGGPRARGSMAWVTAAKSARYPPGALRGGTLARTARIPFRSAGVILLRAVDSRRVPLVAVFAAAAPTAALPLSASLAVLLPIFVVLGLARGVLRTTSAATIAELRNERRDVGLASGIYNSGLDIGTIVGPALGGVIASAFGIAAMFQIMAVVSLLAWLAVAVSSPITREAAGLTKRHTIGPPA